MSNRPTDIETVVLSREYLETVHGRMTFSEAREDDDDDDETVERPALPRDPVESRLG